MDVGKPQFFKSGGQFLRPVLLMPRGRFDENQFLQLVHCMILIFFDKIQRFLHTIERQ